MSQVLELGNDEHTLAILKAGKKLNRIANKQRAQQDKEETCDDLILPRYLFIDVTCEKGDSIALTGIFKGEFPMMFY